MSLLMIHEAYMPVYIGSIFSLRTYGSTRGSTRGPRGPKKKILLGKGREAIPLIRFTNRKHQYELQNEFSTLLGRSYLKSGFMAWALWHAGPRLPCKHSETSKINPFSPASTPPLPFLFYPSFKKSCVPPLNL